MLTEVLTQSFFLNHYFSSIRKKIVNRVRLNVPSYEMNLCITRIEIFSCSFVLTFVTAL